MLERGELTEGHARAMLAVPDHGPPRARSPDRGKKGLSVRATERAARWAGARRSRAAADDPRPGARRAREDGRRAHHRLPRAGRAGRLEVAFGGESELEELVEALERVAP